MARHAQEFTRQRSPAQAGTARRDAHGVSTQLRQYLSRGPAEPSTTQLDQAAPRLTGLVRVAATLVLLIVVILTGWLHSSGRWPFTPSVGPAPAFSIPSPALGRPAQVVAPATALAVLATLEVKGKAGRSDYQRSAFGQAWLDADTNGCDTRNDVLRRDLTAVTFTTGSLCVVASGTLTEPYTGVSRHFTRGTETSAALQIDHVVALGNAWQTGAAALTALQRQSLANDPLNLLAVDGDANQDKRDSDAASWLPPAKKFRCHYVARQISVKAAYSLWVTPAEKEAMETILGHCPQQAALGTGYLK